MPFPDEAILGINFFSAQVNSFPYITSGRRPRVIRKWINECWEKVDSENCLIRKRHSLMQPLINLHKPEKIDISSWNSILCNKAQKERNSILGTNNVPNFDLNINFFWFSRLSCVKHEKSSKKHLYNKNEKTCQIEAVKFVKL